jgi:hypothetical protein
VAAGVRHHVVLGIVKSDAVPFPYYAAPTFADWLRDQPSTSG